jgi:hypothetical protein
MKSTNRKDWPGIPAGLKYVDLRLPGTFRELVANENFTNEQIGRIIRCLALDTDYFIDHDIEVEVRYYRQCLVSRNNTRLRVQACRKRRKEGAAGVLSSAMEKSVSSENGASVTVTESAEKSTSGTVDSLSFHEKTPSDLKEKHPPIVPPKKKAPISLEKSGRGDKRERIAAGIQSDLFMSSFGAEDGSRAPGSPETASTSPQKSEEASGGAVAPQYIESPSSGVIRRSGGMHNSEPSFDSRNDMAWIPERFSVFWSKYPRKVAKADALKAFTKIIKVQSDVEVFMATLMASLEWWKRQQSWIKDGGKFIPHPATWLNRGNWEDSKENSESGGGAQFLRGNDESDEELIRRMQGG